MARLVEVVRALVTGDHAEQLGEHIRRYNALRDALREHDEASEAGPQPAPRIPDGTPLGIFIVFAEKEILSAHHTEPDAQESWVALTPRHRKRAQIAGPFDLRGHGPTICTDCQEAMTGEEKVSIACEATWLADRVAALETENERLRTEAKVDIVQHPQTGTLAIVRKRAMRGILVEVGTKGARQLWPSTSKVVGSLVDAINGTSQAELDALTDFDVGAEEARNRSEATQLRCERTGNECGTDTVHLGWECPCVPCTEWRRQRSAAATPHVPCVGDEVDVLTENLWPGTKREWVARIEHVDAEQDIVGLVYPDHPIVGELWTAMKNVRLRRAAAKTGGGA